MICYNTYWWSTQPWSAKCVRNWKHKIANPYRLVLLRLSFEYKQARRMNNVFELGTHLKCSIKEKIEWFSSSLKVKHTVLDPVVQGGWSSSQQDRSSSICYLATLSNKTMMAIVTSNVYMMQSELNPRSYTPCGKRSVNLCGIITYQSVATFMFELVSSP